jgi:hypothetical protein
MLQKLQTLNKVKNMVAHEKPKIVQIILYQC